MPGLDIRARLDGIRADLLERVRRSVRFERREAIAIVVLVALVVCGAGLSYARARPADAGSLAPVEPAAEQDGAAMAAGQIVVHVVGAVRKPGVYDFPDGARVVDAVKAAGGFTKRADRQQINLARPLVDGEQLVIPARGSAASGAVGPGPTAGGTGAAGSTKVNINLATAADLETLPGIGPVLAERIVAYREQHGPFRSVTDLQKVSGIGPKIYEGLEPVVTV